MSAGVRPSGAGPIAAALVCLAVAACGEEIAGLPRPSAPGAPTREVRVTVRLEEDLFTFKLDARLRLRFERPGPPAGIGVGVGTFVLPADAREATFQVDLPQSPGRLVVREETVSEAVPFLCGAAPGVDPRTDDSITVVLALCQPGTTI